MTDVHDIDKNTNMNLITNRISDRYTMRKLGKKEICNQEVALKEIYDRKILNSYQLLQERFMLLLEFYSQHLKGVNERLCL